MTKHLALGLALLLIVDTSFTCTTAEEAAPEATAEVAETERVPEDWRLEVARAAMVQAFARLTGMELELAQEIVPIVEREAGKHDLDPFRILGFIVAESNGKARAYSSAGARGLMQIMPRTGQFIAHSLGEKWQGTKSLYEVETNITYGVWYYNHLLEFFEGDEHAAMSAYNWGPENIEFRLNEGRRLPVVYPDKVLKAQERLEREFGYEGTKRFWEHLNRDVNPPSTEEQVLGSDDAAPSSSLPLDIGESS